MSRRILLIMRNVTNKICTENQNTHSIFSKVFTGNRAVYELPRNVEKYGRVIQATDDNIIRRMRICMPDT